MTFFRLGKVKPWDAFFYVIAQFVGGLAWVILIAAALRSTIAHPSINYAVTVPGMNGAGIAFLSELIISLILMSVILTVSNTLSIARFTGLFAGVLVAICITLEAPFSGMSMNPARTFASALPVHLWTAL